VKNNYIYRFECWSYRRVWYSCEYSTFYVQT